MARGWESKAVESQREDVQPQILSPKKKKSLERQQQKEREGFEIQKRRIERELAATSSPVRRTALENALQFLDEKLKQSH